MAIPPEKQELSISCISNFPSLNIGLVKKVLIIEPITAKYVLIIPSYLGL